MKNLSLDIETYSTTDIGKCGLYKYVENKNFEILLFAYSVDFGPVRIVDFAQGESLSEEIMAALADDTVIKHAYNAAFEYNALRAGGYDVGNLSAWHCTMFHATYLGYPAGLKATGEALGLAEESAKSATGAALIRYFSVPCKPTKSNGGRARNLPAHDPARWQLFKDYCVQDVVAETAIYKHLFMFEVPEREWRLWQLSERMNLLGVGVDLALICGALEIDDVLTKEQVTRSKELSGLENPNSAAQILAWLQHFLPEVENVRKTTVEDLLKRDDLAPQVREFLEIRQELSKTSLKKYSAMADCVCEDRRVHGILQFYGANRTGRWAGRLVQVQNLPRNYLNSLDAARELAKSCDIESLRTVYGNVTDTLSQLIRTAFVPGDGRKFIISDYSAIEARVIAWLAGEKWVNEVFASHGKIYEATAAQMFGVPIEKIAKGNPEYALRQKGKVATLALGYQGGEGALIAMGADSMGLSGEELTEIKSKWREANPNIVRFWYSLQNAAIRVVETGETQDVRGLLTLRLECDIAYGQKFLTIELPSGRKLYYPEPEIREGNFGKPAVYFMGIGANKKFTLEQTYGGKLTENVVQAIARDCLAELLLRLDERYPNDPVVMHIHDEVVLDARESITVDEINAVMAEPIPWAPGLILKGAGFEGPYYKKD